MAVTSDFIKLEIGDRVYDVADPRHIGRVDRVRGPNHVDITWEETGWRSLAVPGHALRRATYVRMWRALEPKEE
jgi:hypothetical protein